MQGGSPRLQDSHLGDIVAPDTPQTLLKAYPDGAYTTVLVRSGEVVDIESHLKRLSSNVSELHQKGRFKGLVSEGSNVTVAEKVREEFLRLLQSMNPHDVSTAVMVLVATDKHTQTEEREHKGEQLQPLRLALYLKDTKISDLQDPIKAVVVGPGRVQPGIKDTNWVSTRQGIAAKVPADASEGLLQDAAGCLLEGLVTNFCVVRSQEGTSQLMLETAPVETVLEGTVRARVIAAAHMCGLSVRETAPDPQQRGSWSEAFVCNALRILQPVKVLECPDEDAPGELGGWRVRLKGPEDSVTGRLREAVLATSQRAPVSELLNGTYAPPQ